MHALVLAGSFFLSIPVFSYDIDIQKCTDIASPDERLRCYDAIFQEKKLTKDSTSLSKNQEAKTIDQQKENDYGLEKSTQDFSITAKIINVNKQANFKIYITLDNKQVWRSVKDFYDRTPVRKGETVSISEGFMSGYVMKVQGKKNSLRVRRIK
ncbi:MAG: hypothetical protein EBR50_03530 [Proteobacteria bacterium]|nr:hypothetical protein [Pseudomonadota bacterium]